MKTAIFLLTVFLIYTLLPYTYSMPGRITKGPGIAFSGAGARISQIYALLEVLVKGEYPGGKPLRPSFVSGASSGSIITVLTSAIFENIETGRGNMTWTSTKKLLSELKTSCIIDNSYEGYAKIPLNMLEGFFLDNSPGRTYLTRIIHDHGYYKLKDLYIPTFISVVNRSSGETIRLSSLDPVHGELDIIEVLMASTAIPVVFKPMKIYGLGNNFYVDGGTGIDQIPTTDLLQEPLVTEIYALTYSSALIGSIDKLPKWLEHLSLLYNAMAAFSDMRVQITRSGLSVLANQSSKRAWQYIPTISKIFSTLNFEHQIEEYRLVKEWALMNAPLRLNPKMSL